MACRALGELSLRMNLPRKDVLASEEGSFPIMGEDAAPACEAENLCFRHAGSHIRANSLSRLALNVTHL